MTPDQSEGDHTSADYSNRGLEVPGERIEYREVEGEDNVFEVRMPIATTGEVRNDGDDPLTRDELAGMARQIDDRNVGVFLDHGRSPIGGPERYSATEKVGEWQAAEVRERDVDRDGERQDGTDELMATARMMDPETLPAASGTLRESLAAIKEQVKRDMSLAASIGWREDDAYPGGNDLMEASIVGIGADPRTVSDAEAAVVARAAVDAGADGEALVEAVRDAIDHDMTDDNTESAEEADAEQDDTTDEERQAPEWAERLVELQEEQMDTLATIAESVRPKDEDDEEEDDEEDNATDEDEEDEEEDEDENAADVADEEQDAADDDARELADEVESLREELADLRDGGLDADDVDTPDTDEEQDADEAESERDADDHELTNKYGIEA